MSNRLRLRTFSVPVNHVLVVFGIIAHCAKETVEDSHVRRHFVGS